MDKNNVYIVLRLELEQPAQLDDFVSAFTALSSQYQKFIREKYPDVSEQAQVYVSEVKKGSIEAELIPWAVATANVALNYMDRVLIVDEFVRYYGGRLSAYFRQGGRDDNANNSDLKDFMGEVSSIAKDPNGSGTISSATFEDGKKNVRASITFNSDQAKNAVREIDNHKKELENRGETDFRRVVMVFHQSNVKDSSPGKRTGEWVSVEHIQEKPLPLVYASNLAEQRIKYEIREGSENIYKKGFVVDVNVETKGGRPIAYRVTNLHDVIDIPDE